MKTSINKYKHQWTVISADRIKQKKEYQEWRTIEELLQANNHKEKISVHMNTKYKNSGT
jgi:hypothetical protein